MWGKSTHAHAIVCTSLQMHTFVFFVCDVWVWKAFICSAFDARSFILLSLGKHRGVITLWHITVQRLQTPTSTEL